MCVLTVWASITDPTSTGDRRLIEHGHQNPWRLLEVLGYVQRLGHLNDVVYTLVQSPESLSLHSS